MPTVSREIGSEVSTDAQDLTEATAADTEELKTAIEGAIMAEIDARVSGSTLSGESPRASNSAGVASPLFP